MLPLAPDMASLAVGPNNFPTRVYENAPDLVDWLAAEMIRYDIKPEVEAFDLSHPNSRGKLGIIRKVSRRSGYTFHCNL